MKIEYMFKQPADFSVGAFKCCDNFGGSAFRDWYMLLKHKGIFIGYHNHDWCVLFSSDPKAEWWRGCQESRANGDARPQSKTAKFVSYDELPDAGKKLAVKWVAEAIKIARKEMKESEKREKAEVEIKQQQAKREWLDNIVSPWEKAAQEELS